MYRDRALEIATKLLPAFDTPSGVSTIDWQKYLNSIVWLLLLLTVKISKYLDTIQFGEYLDWSWR